MWFTKHLQKYWYRNQQGTSIYTKVLFCMSTTLIFLNHIWTNILLKQISHTWADEELITTVLHTNSLEK